MWLRNEYHCFAKKHHLFLIIQFTACEFRICAKLVDWRPRAPRQNYQTRLH